jgi:hypothetical protein
LGKRQVNDDLDTKILQSQKGQYPNYENLLYKVFCPEAVKNNLMNLNHERKITKNAHKRKICQIAARDHHAVHSILLSPDHGYGSRPASKL